MRQSAQDCALAKPMDVTCDRCGTDYEFEEALVSTRGTTVKCTQCGHLFKVYKPQAPAEASGEKHPWTVRATDGTSHRLSSLSDLTRLIGEGVFTRHDEVSRTGKAWKRLGDIDELKGFFPDSERPPARARRPTTPELGLRQPSIPPAPPGANASLPRGVSSAPPPAPPTAPETKERKRTPTLAGAPAPGPQSVPAQPPVPRFETMGATVDLNARGETPTPATSANPPPRPASSASPPDPAEVKAATRRRTTSGEIVASAQPAAARPAHAQASTPTPPVAPASAPAAIGPAAPAPRSRSPWMLSLWILLAVAAVGGGALLLSPRVSQHLTQRAPKVDPTAEFMARADAAFATHRTQHFEDAITEYVKALAYHETDPHILSSISRVYAVWAQELRFKLQTLGARSARDVEQRSEWMALDREARQLSEQAKRYAESAARKNPGNEEAEVALSDALRLSGNLVAARSELDRANASGATPNAETLRVAALLTIDEAEGDLRVGLKLASQAVAQEPDLIRARLLLARCLVAEGDIAAARYHLNAVTVRDRSHPGVVAVETDIEQRAQPKTPEDAGVADAGEKPKPEAAPAPEDLSHDGYITRGQALLERGQVQQAKRMFEQALFIRPSSPKAHIGLGYVALEMGRSQLAVQHFAPAAQKGNASALIGLGDAYRRLKRPRDAMKAYQNYLTREPTGPQANIARAQLERLGEELGASRP